MSDDIYEIIALKYGRHANRTRLDNFMQPDDHASPQPIDYFVFLIRNRARTILVDTGFDHAEATPRGRVLDREPVEALGLLGIDPEKIETCIISHLHYDHAGTMPRFPKARFHLQDAEMAYATGRCMCEEAMRKPFTAEHVCEMVKNVYAGRVQFHDGDGEVAPGVTVHKCAGHTQGLQAIRVKTTGGYVVLAMDAAHLYENIERRKPFSITIDVAETLRTYDKLYALASSKAQVVPGHDPLILERYPALDAATKGIAHRLDVARIG
jgi:glyoxylase-like metal-dependent hydrolase (beta-lactamase superfamily II)